MKLQIIIIALLLGALAWVAAFDGTRDLYHVGQSAGLVPNLHVKHHLRELL